MKDPGHPLPPLGFEKLTGKMYSSSLRQLPRTAFYSRRNKTLKDGVSWLHRKDKKHFSFFLFPPKPQAWPSSAGGRLLPSPPLSLWAGVGPLCSCQEWAASVAAVASSVTLAVGARTHGPDEGADLEGTSGEIAWIVNLEKQPQRSLGTEISDPPPVPESARLLTVRPCFRLLLEEAQKLCQTTGYHCSL